MSCSMEFFETNYNLLHSGMATDLFSLREKTFNSRLAWQVECKNGMEKDHFDNENTIYLLGMSQGHLVCGARFIDICHENMITTVFSDFFDGISLPDDAPCYDVSRLFIDKKRRETANLTDKPVSRAMFVAMIKLCQKNNREGMYAIVSRGMYRIFMLSGWNVKMLKKGWSEKNEAVYFIYMPATQEAIHFIREKEIDCAFIDSVAYPA
ncbi:acyl-homoserine-lactone synthase [Dryocola sp. LX212]